MAPLPDGYGAIPGAAQDVAALSGHARVLLVSPRIRPSAQRGGGYDRWRLATVWRSPPRSWLVLSVWCCWRLLLTPLWLVALADPDGHLPGFLQTYPSVQAA